jgi:LmbE family N-acetylglucosaminyl deacetylase
MGVREGLANWRRRLWSEGGQGRLLRSLATGATLWPEATAFSFSPVDEDFRLKALLVVAHPDDESECAAVLYRITHELGGTVDQIVVTNGEAGHQYSAPAEAYYRLSLNEQEAGRKRLACVRRWEVIRASRILGIRHNYFFEQKDTGLTFDVRAGFQAWDLDRIHRQLFRLLDSEEYDLVFVLLP